MVVKRRRREGYKNRETNFCESTFFSIKHECFAFIQTYLVHKYKEPGSPKIIHLELTQMEKIIAHALQFSKNFKIYFPSYMHLLMYLTT